LNFSIRCDDFNVSFYKTGSPKEYRSSLTVIEEGKPVFQKNIIVNNPLRYKGINIFQSSYGTIPPKDITLKFTSRETGMVYQKKASFDKEIDVPENFGTFILKDFSNTGNFGGHQIGETFIGLLTPRNGKSVKIMLPARYPNFDQMRKDKFIISIAEHEHLYYTGLQVTKDPGVHIVYLGFIIMLIGCFLSFFMSHQQLCIEVFKKGKIAKVMIAGKANKNKFGMQRKIKKLAHTIANVP
jgi:cytochrome c biogenesis protein